MVVKYSCINLLFFICKSCVQCIVLLKTYQSVALSTLYANGKSQNTLSESKSGTFDATTSASVCRHTPQTAHATSSNQADIYFFHSCLPGSFHVSLIHQGSSLQTDAHTE